MRFSGPDAGADWAAELATAGVGSGSDRSAPIGAGGAGAPCLPGPACGSARTRRFCGRRPRALPTA